MPAPLLPRRTTDEMLLLLRIDRAPGLPPLLPRGIGGRTRLGVGLLAGRSGRRRRAARQERPADGRDLARRRLKPARDLGPEAEDGDRRTVPVHRDVRA